METTWRWSLLAAVAPVTWGAAYFVTAQTLPATHPLWGSVLRALPAGVVLLAIARRAPRGAWWWRSLVLGALNMSAFFVLVYVAAQRLPTSVASTVMAVSPFALALVAWPLLGQRPRAASLAGAGLGLAGVVAMLLTGSVAVDPLGVLAGAAAMLMSSVGFVLATRWKDDVDVLTTTSWQLVAGGLLLVPVAALVEGGPPTLDARGWLGMAFLSLVATALAYVAWFTALHHLPASAVGLVGLLNPVTGVVVGLALGGEHLTGRQTLGVAAVLAAVLLGQPALQARLRRRRPVVPADPDVVRTPAPVPAGRR
ncbi:DMT family transporter [Cellulomonas dongxiuzhuiae]|uniref:DMT family transporter n=1 Tax=Cellulomonas dongxiuzhuiae TaxID=2819979 RepID=A0ABX8GHC6_9CELL|nr:DMT family transporter [Cellulomonas dongxiuzhuiae]MBO3088589.1 EamA family transporter [Cellulomonas dongxiuzhuiae]MBO3094077.1 EamA family transporter [Cellulomonas dongxiuzhuiae]QWC15142.1 DMT family transporter [Cellulomonas dongxiuzhuiae]